MKIDDLIFDEDLLEKEIPTEEQEIIIEEEEIPEQNPQKQEENDDTAKVFFNALVEKGYFEEDPNFDGSYDSLDSKLESLPLMIQENILNQVNPELKDVLEFILEGKNNLSREEVFNFIKSQENSIETADEAREFLEGIYKSKNLTQRAIDAQLDDMEEEGTLLEEAKKIKESYIKDQIKEKQTLNLKEQERQKAFNDSLVNEINSFDANKQKLIKNTLSNINSIVKEISQDPKKYISFVDVLTRYKDGKFDFSDIEQKGSSKTAASLKESLSKANIKSSIVNSGSKPNLREEDLKLTL